MPELLTIDRTNKLPPAQDYNFLRKEGIKYIEDLAGKVWTDYNTHDPGITLLEAMCYALTDLGYRTSFDIADIIAPHKKAVADKWKNIFYTARQALPCNPLTLIDYRKLIIDTEGVRNAWIEISDDYEILIYLEKTAGGKESTMTYNLTYDFKRGDDVLRLRGLYKVFVEYEDDILEQKKEEEVAKVIWQKLQFHRNLTEDFISVSSVEYEDFPIDAIIQVSEGSDIEMINARIYKIIHDFFSPPINFYSLEQMMDRKGSAEDVFDGPVLNYGFIDTEELVKSERFKNIHLSDIINIISGIDGVIAVKKFTFQIDAHSPFINFSEWINNIKDKQKIPRLDIKGSTVIFKRSGDRPLDDDKRQVNKERVNAIFSFLNSDNLKTRLRGASKDLPVPEGEFMNIADYYPFQKELPAVYGMNKTFLNDKDTIDKSTISLAIKELIGEKAGNHVATFLTKLLNKTRHRNYLENIVKDILNSKGPKLPPDSIIDAIWEKEIEEPYFKTIIIEILKVDKEFSFDKSHLNKYIDQPAQPKTASNKSNVLMQLAVNELKKNLVEVKTPDDIAKLNSQYKIYEVSLLEQEKKLVLQLRGFLMVFEQVLADYLSQLSHTREIFSFSDKVLQNFYPQVVDGINDMEALFIDFKQYQDSSLLMLESREKFNDKRNNILNHLLARFGETMDKYSFFMQQFAGKKAQGKLISDKVDFLRDYVQISSYRGKAYNYADENENWDSNNVEGLKKRICRLLGINNYKREKIAPGELFIEKIVLDNKLERYIVKLVDPKNKSDVLLTSIEFEFENEAITILTYLLEEGYDRKLYKEEGHGDKWSFEINRLTPENVFEPIARSRYFKTSNDKTTALEKAIDTLNGFSEAENFHVLEHILLRPKIGSRQKEKSSDEVTLLPVEYVPDEIRASVNTDTEMPYKFKIVQVKDQSNKGKNLWKLSLMKNDVEFLKVNEDFIFYKHLTGRIDLIRAVASDRSNYVTEQTIDGQYTFKIMSGKTMLAESKKNFKKEEDIEEEIKNLVNFLSYEFGLISGMGKENDPAMYADPYSFQISIILPTWQRRFRNSTFKHLLEKTIYLETPSHIYPHVYWVDHHEMREFDEAFEVWVKEMAFNEIPATDVVNNMIAALKNLKSQNYHV